MDRPVEHITVDGDTPRTRNRNVKVRMIAQMHFDGGASVEEVAEHYEISLADVYSALTYYFDHKAYFDERDARNEQLMREYGQPVSRLIELARERDRQAHDLENK